jgi:hypothetical protein
LLHAGAPRDGRCRKILMEILVERLTLANARLAGV